MAAEQTSRAQTSKGYGAEQGWRDFELASTAKVNSKAQSQLKSRYTGAKSTQKPLHGAKVNSFGGSPTQPARATHISRRATHIPRHAPRPCTLLPGERPLLLMIRDALSAGHIAH
eukprot:scaffold33610_cov52-Phaeocystis_antarctica.AAC.2